MALFRRDKAEDSKPADQRTAATAPDVSKQPTKAVTGLEVDPVKAEKFFQHARTVQESTNYEYAMQLWLRGLAFEPANMTAIESFFAAAASFLGSGKKAVSKDTAKAVEVKGDVGKFIEALLNWAMRPLDAINAVRATEAASKLGLAEPTYWLGERAQGAVMAEKKPRKDLMIKLVDAFGKVGAFDKAVQAGELAVRLDPSDGQLAAAIKNLAAQATMAKGGFEDSGKEGGFRRNVKDLDKQRELEETDRISKTAEGMDRLLASAADAYAKAPDDLVAARNYAKRLIERGTEEDEAQAFKVLSRAYEQTKEFGFRQMAGDLRLRKARRRLAQLRDAAQAPNADDTAKARYQQATRQFLEMEADEYKLRVDAFATDLMLKYELARRYFELGRWNESIPLLQTAQRDPKVRIPSMSMLGRCFLQIDFLEGAEQAFRGAIDAHRTATDELGMELRYWLMHTLITRADKERDLAKAEEADKIATAIALQQYDYRDVGTRRERIKEVIGRLRSASPA